MTGTPLQPPDLPGFRYHGPVEGGEGGYAKVFRYEQQSPRRLVAVKVLRGRGLGHLQYQAMLNEATAMAVLETHPHIVPVIEAKMSSDGQPCIIMMFCGGPDLMTLVADESAPGGRPRLLSVRRVVRLGVQIAGVVQAAHEKGIVHRDIKPANILTDDRGSPRLTDFGIAGRLGDVDEDDRQFGLSLPWCPPEVLAGQRATEASDLFSLGATLWHLLAGRSPFDVAGRNSQPELEARIAQARPPSVGRRDVPQKLEQLLASMMAKRPDRRPGSAAKVAAELTSIEQQIGALRPEEPWHTEHPRPVPASGQADLVRTTSRPRSGATPSGAWPTPQPSVPVPAPPTRYAIPGLLPSETRKKPRPDSRPEPVPVPPPRPVTGRRAMRWVGVAGVVVLVVAAAGLVALRPWQQKAPPRQSIVDDGRDAGGGAGGPGDNLPPGKPAITAARIDGQTLRFSWTYSAPLDNDTYLWRTTNGGQAEAVTDPTVDVKGRAGTRVCIVVKVVRADGSYATVAWSDEGCGG